MSREYAQIMTAIWRNAEFCRLSEIQQRAYLFLVSQEDISAAGTLHLRLRLWSSLSSSSTPESLAQVFKELEVGRFIVVDYDTEEVLIRSFIRWDRGYNNPKRKPVIIRAAAEARSRPILLALAQEFRRCDLPMPPNFPPDRPDGGSSDSDTDSLSGTASDSPSEINKADVVEGPFPQVDTLFDTASPSDGVVVTYCSKGPQPTTLEPQPVPPSAAAGAGPTAQDLVGEWIDRCRARPPKRVIGQVSGLIKELLDEGIDPDDVRAGIATWATKALHPSTLPSVVHEVMNRPAQPALRVVGGTAMPITMPANLQGTSSQRAAAFLALRKGNQQ